MDARLELLETELGIRTTERDEARVERDRKGHDLDNCERNLQRLLLQRSD